MIMKFISEIRRQLEARKYDHYSLSVYFRKQGARIGEHCYFNIRFLADQPYLIKIGNHVQVAAGVKFITHNPGWCFRHIIPDLQIFGSIIVEDNCYIGENAILLPNINIGKNGIVAAGAVVTKSMPPNSIVAGNPAKVIGTTSEYFEKCKEIWAKQKPEGYLSEFESEKLISPKHFAKVRDKKRNEDLLRRHLETYFWKSENGCR